MATNYKPSTVQCTVCHDGSGQVRLLPCKHGACTHCLQDHLSKSATDNALPCPSCGQECQLPAGGLAELPLANQETVAAAEVCTQSGNSLGTSPSVFCVNTEHGNATIFCTDCTESYCRPCASYHDVVQSMTGGHRIKPVAQMTASEIKQARATYNSTCTQHEQPFTFYCKTCQLLLCAKCAARRHIDHQCEELGQSARDAQMELEQIAQTAASYLTRHDDVLAELRKTEDKIHLDVKTAKADIKAAAARLHNIIEEHEETLSRNLHRFEADTLEKVMSMQKEAETSKVSSRHDVEDVESLRNSSGIAQIVHASGKKSELEKQTRMQQRIAWKLVSQPKGHAKKYMQAMLGTVSLKSSDAIIAGSSTMERPLRSVPLVYGGNRVAIGMVVVGDCLCVIHDGESRLWLYDMVRGRRKTCDIPGLGCTRGMAVVKAAGRTLSQSDWSLEGVSAVNCQVEATGVVSVAAAERSGSLVITDQCGGTCELHFVEVSPQDLSITDHRVRNIPLKNPSGISASAKTGQLLIGQNDNMEFAICSKEGDIRRKVKVPGAGGSVKCVSETREGYMALVWEDGSKGTIRWLGRDGSCSHTYGQSQEEQLKRPFLIQDRVGSLIVADRGNDRLHLVGTSRRLSEYLLTKEAGLCAPQCVYLDEGRGRLYVAHGRPGSQEVRVYGWPAQSADTNLTNFELDVQLGNFS